MGYDAGFYQMMYERVSRMYERVCRERDSVVEKLATVAIAHDRLLADNKRIINDYESSLTQLRRQLSSDGKLIARLERDIEHLKPKSAPEPKAAPEPKPEPAFQLQPKRPRGRPRKLKEPA